MIIPTLQISGLRLSQVKPLIKITQSAAGLGHWFCMSTVRWNCLGALKNPGAWVPLLPLINIIIVIIDVGHRLYIRIFKTGKIKIQCITVSWET